MKLLSILTNLLLLLSYTLARNVAFDEQWNLWKHTHKRIYSSGEEHHRRTIWENNLKLIEEHNEKADRGLHTYWLGMNKYGDWNTNEFKQFLKGFKPELQQGRTQSRPLFTPSSNTTLPDSVDWRDKGDVVPPKDQGQCGSCWAFSAVGAIESAHAINTGKLVSLSEQQLMDCSVSFGNMGCDGGLMDVAFEYLMSAGGIETEDVYPYSALSQTCVFNASNVIVKVCAFIDVPPNNEINLQQAVAAAGPTSVGIDASHQSFQFYQSGIYNEPACSSTELNHAVLVIGYGTISSQDYWLVKNSWGTSWGMKGYIMMTRNRNNQCGIAAMPSYPVVC